MSDWDLIKCFESFFCCCCPQYETENEGCHRREGTQLDALDLSYYLNACPDSPPTPSTALDSILYPQHYLSTLHPIIVQPPPNYNGAHGIRRLTNDRRFSPSSPLPHSPSPGPVIYVVSNGILTADGTDPRFRPPSGPGRAVRTRPPSHTRAPPGYSSVPPSRGGAETAEPPPYRDELPAVPEYPGRGDGTMSAPTFQGRERR